MCYQTPVTSQSVNKEIKKLTKIYHLIEFDIKYDKVIMFKHVEHNTVKYKKVM